MIYLMEMFFKRVEKAWRDFNADVENRTVLLVSHSGVMEAVLCIENGVQYTNRKRQYEITEAEILCI